MAKHQDSNGTQASMFPDPSANENQFVEFFLFIKDCLRNSCPLTGEQQRWVLGAHLLASAVSLRAVGPATVLSHKCDILSLLKEDQIVRDNRLPVHSRHLAPRRHRTAIPVATQMSLPPVRLPN